MKIGRCIYMKREAGFTMMELLAAVVILGILAGIAIPTTMNIVKDQKNNIYIQDALRLATNMDYKMRKDNKAPVPARGSCVAMNLTILDNNTFNDAPYDGSYDRLASFVIAKRSRDVLSDEEYTYYVRLIEATKSGAYRGVDLVKTDDLYKDKAKDMYVSNLPVGEVVSLHEFLSNPSSLVTLLDDYSIDCDSVIIYAPNADRE